MLSNKNCLLLQDNSVNSNKLTQKLKECFKPNELHRSGITKTALVQAKLTLEHDPDTPFDGELSDAALAQLTKTICNIGDLSILDKIKKEDSDMKEITELKSIIAEYIAKKEAVVSLDDKTIREKLANIESYKQQNKKYNLSLKSTLEPSIDLQKGFLDKERKKNIALKQEVDQLQNECKCMEKIDSGSSLDNALREMDKEYHRITDIDFSDDTSNSSFSCLSFSFESSP